jgi:hypothetical protein
MSYQIRFQDFVHIRQGDSVLLVRDGLDDHLEMELAVRSGDFFEYLATKLSDIAEGSDDMAVYSDLDKLSEDLLYLKTKYSIQKLANR